MVHPIRVLLEADKLLNEFCVFSFFFFFFFFFLICTQAVHPIRVLLKVDSILSECDEPLTLKARSAQVLWV